MPTASTVFEVMLAVSLPMTEAAFDESKRTGFRAAIAAAAAVPAADVRIVSVASMAGRRLLTASIRVDTAVAASDSNAASAMAAMLTVGSITSNLNVSGLPAATMLQSPTPVQMRAPTAPVARVSAPAVRSRDCAFLAAEEEQKLLFALGLDTWTKSDVDDVRSVVYAYYSLTLSRYKAVSAACRKHLNDAAGRLETSPAARPPAMHGLAVFAALNFATIAALAVLALASRESDR